MDYSKGLAKIAEVDKLSAVRREEIRNTKSDYSKITGTTYYVSNSGNDDNDGLSPNTAWKTIAKVNSFPLKDGDGVLFERGGIWRGDNIKQEKVSVTYSAYGDGEKPKFYGSPENAADGSKWELILDGGNKKIWKFYREDLKDVGSIVFDDGKRYAFKDSIAYEDGAFVVREDEETVYPYDVKEQLDFNYKFAHLADSALTSSGMPAASATGPIYLRCDDGNPGEIFETIEFITRDAGFFIRSHGVTVDNFTVKYVSFGVSGYHFTAIDDLCVQNCEFEWIGGNIQCYNFRGSKGGKPTRFGNGVEIWGGCHNYTVQNCYFNQIYDAAVSPQYTNYSKADPVETENILFRDNLIENSIYGFEFFLDTNRAQYIAKGYGFVIENNIIRKTGFGFGSTRPDRGYSGAMTSGGHLNHYHDFIIRNNIVDRASDHLMIISSHEDAGMPIMENNIYIQGDGDTLLTQNPYVQSVCYKCGADTEEGLKAFNDSSEVYVVPYIPPYEFPFK